MTDRHQQKPFPLRMPVELRTQVEAETLKSGLSVNAEVVRLISEGLAARHGMKSTPIEPFEIVLRRILREELALTRN